MEAHKKGNLHGLKGSWHIISSSLVNFRLGRDSVWSRFFKVLLALLVISWCAGVVSADTMWIKAHGELTAIEEDGRAIINGEGYFVDPQVRVLNARRISCSLKDLKLPAAVLFEYYYTSKGPIIKTIKELPR